MRSDLMAARSDRLESIFRRLHIAILCSFAVVTLLPFLASPDLSMGLLATAVVPAIIYLIVGIDLQWHGWRSYHVPVLLVLVVALLAVQPIYPLWAYGASGFCVAAFTLSAYWCLSLRWHVIASLAVGMLWAAGRATIGGQPSAGFDEALVAVAMTLAGTGFMSELRQQAARADWTRSVNDEQLALSEHQKAGAKAVVRAQRILHDDVIHALREIASGDPDRARQSCSMAVGSLRAVEEVGAAHPETEPVALQLLAATLADQLSAEQDRRVEVTVNHGCPDPLIPPDTREALLRAVGEACRNAMRHSGREDVRVEIAGDQHRLEVSVVDRGVGFRHGATPGFGITQSIREPVARLGGTAQLARTAGGGVTVRLTAPLTDRDATRDGGEHKHTLRAAGSALPLALVAAPIAVIFTTMAARHTQAWDTPIIGLGIWFLEAGVTSVLVWRLSTATFGWGGYLTSVSLLLTALALSLVSMPDGAMLDNRAWPIGFLAVPLMLLTISVRAAAACGLLTLVVGLLVAGWLANPALTNGELPIGAIQAVLLLPALGVGVGVLMRQLGRDIDHEERRLEQITRDRAWQQSWASAVRRHLHYTRSSVIPWLETVLSKHTDVRDPAVQEEAALRANEVRDDLYVPGFFDETLRQHARDFRQRGGKLTLRPGLRDEAWRRPIGAMLISLLPDLDRHHVIVQPTDVPHREISVAVVPPVPRHATHLDHTGLAVDTDAYRTVFNLPDHDMASAH